MAYVWLTWLADALRDEGCNVVEDCGDWKHRGRPSSSGSFNPYGAVHHHTAATASYSNPFPSKSVLINGRSDLPGPLCHVGIGYDGKCHMIAAGRANHGGSHSGWGPFPSGDCNAMMVGWEIDYNGTQDPSPEQVDAGTRASAAVLREWGRDEGYAAIHAETSTTGKWDTGQISGNTWRSKIKTQLSTGGADMPLTNADADLVVDRLLSRKIQTGWQSSDGTYNSNAAQTPTVGSLLVETRKILQVLYASGDAPDNLLAEIVDDFLARKIQTGWQSSDGTYNAGKPETPTVGAMLTETRKILQVLYATGDSDNLINAIDAAVSAPGKHGGHRLARDDD